MPQRMCFIRCSPAVAGIVLAGFVSAAAAAPPQITSITPRGLKAGTNDVTIAGANFTETARLAIDVPGAMITLKPAAKFAANSLQFEVRLPANTPAGLCQARLSTEDGLAKPEMLLVDSLPTTAEKEPNNRPGEAQKLNLPAAIEGRLSGSESDIVGFAGRKGQRIVAEIAGRRLGANIKPVLRLFNKNGLEAALAQPARCFGGDARLIALLPEDGDYFVELNDLVYRGDNKQYRLLIGDLQSADYVFPLGGRPGDQVVFQLGGGSLTKPLPVAASLPSMAGAGLLPLPMPGAANASPFQHVVALGQHPEVREQAVSEKLQSLPLPSVVNGRLEKPGEVDQYTAPVQPGEKLRVFVEAERLGGLLDGVVEIRDAKGKTLVTLDDGPGTADPDAFYTAPANVNAVTLAIKDGYGRGGEAFVYRLGVERAGAGDFQLTLLDPLVNIPVGGTASVRVRAVRRDYQGAISLKLAGDVPAGAKLSGAEIPAGVNDTLLSLSVPAGEQNLQAGTVQVIGEGGSIVRSARIDAAAEPAYDGAPWLLTRLPSAVTKAGPFTLEVEPLEVALLKGMPFTAKVKVRRAADATGAIKLSLQSSQQPQQQLKIPPNQTIAEKADEAVFRVDVPANAAEIPVALVIKGELLDPKTKKTVLGAAEAPALATRITKPFAVEDIEPVKLQAGMRHLLPVKITRLGAFKEPVQLVVAGIPANFRSGPASLTVAGDVSEVRLPIVVPVNQKAGEVKLQVTASWKSTPPINLPPVAATLPIIDAPPPALLEVFEDGEDFVAALTEGSGKVAVETKDVHSGKEALQVAGVKARSALPGLGVPIAENPQPGQYRYLRFAWKSKKGALALQVGPNVRYAAGADKTPKTIQVAEQVPTEWTVVTRDLFADGGAFNLTGLSFVANESEGLFDHVYLARSVDDFPKR